MIFQTFSSIDNTEFSTIFQDSLPILDAGSFPWHLYPQVISQSDKEIHIRDAYNRALEDAEAFVWEVREDNDKLLLLNVGTIDGINVKWFLSLISPNTAGTKSYLYSDEYKAARNSFWAGYGVTTITMETFGGIIGDHIANKVSSGGMYGTSTTVDRNIKTPTDATIITLTDVSVTII